GHVIKPTEFGSVFRTWWLSDFSGALVVTPFLLVWAKRRSLRMPRLQLAEGALLLAILIVLIEVPSQQDVPYIVFPILIWSALRFGPAGAASALAIVSPFLRVSQQIDDHRCGHDLRGFVRVALPHVRDLEVLPLDGVK